MNKNTRPTIMMAGMLLASHILALILVLPFQQLGYNEAFDNPDDPTPLLFYIGFMLLFTGILLLIFKYRRGEMLKYFMYFAFGMIVFYVMVVPFVYIFYYGTGINGRLLGDTATAAGLIATIVLMFFYAVKQDWRITNAVGVMVAAGAIGILGVNFSILPIFLFLTFLAIYDYIAVYKTKHMITLADGVLSLGVPMMLTAPKKGVKLKAGHKPKVGIKESLAKKKERDALYMGLGDLITVSYTHLRAHET